MEYWYTFPISIAVASVAMASGVEGATFFAPIFILGLGLSPEIAVGSGLITETFGFASGLFAYIRRRLIDYKLGTALIVVTVPAAILGSWLSNRFDPLILKIILGLGLIIIGAHFIWSKPVREARPREHPETDLHKGPERIITTADGQQIGYPVPNTTEGRTIAGVGAFFMGMISTGLGQLNGYFMLKRAHIPSKVAVATSVFVVAISALAGATGHMVQFAQRGDDALDTVLSVVMFTVPGVLIGGQIGPAIAARTPQHVLERALGLLFLAIGAFMLVEWFA